MFLTSKKQNQTGRRPTGGGQAESSGRVSPAPRAPWSRLCLPFEKGGTWEAFSFYREDVKHGFSNKTSILLVLAFTLPVCVLLGWVILNEYQLKFSQTLILPVEGYDPRDLLSGRYLTYKVHYGVDCPKPQEYEQKTTAYICFKPKKHITLRQKPQNCSLFIKGRCLNNEFLANIDRYYIPEKKAHKAEKLFRQAKKKQVVLAVWATGQALVRDILVDEKSLKKHLN